MEGRGLPNPYTPGELPRVLAGREQQQDRIRGLLSRVATYGEMGGPLLVFLGPRGVGKTSLLREAQRDAEEHGFLTAWVSCRRSAPFLPDVVSRVARAVDDAGVVDRREQGRWRLRLEKLAVEIGVPSGVKLTASAVTTAAPSPESAGGARMSALEDLLHETSTRVRERGGAGLVIFVDELHAPTRDDTAVMLNAVQNLAGDRANNPLAVVAAGLPSTPAALTKAATFGERSTFVTLPRLSVGAAEVAVLQPALALGVTWTRDALAAIVDEAQGFPYFLQVLAHAAWEVTRPTPGQVLDARAVEAGVPVAGNQLTTMYAARWGAATDLEKALMGVMARLGTPVVSRAAIAAALGRSTQSLGVPRDRLIDKGIIEPAGHGELRFTLPGFDGYVREVTATGRVGTAPPGAGPERDDVGDG